MYLLKLSGFFRKLSFQNFVDMSSVVFNCLTSTHISACDIYKSSHYILVASKMYKLRFMFASKSWNFFFFASQCCNVNIVLAIQKIKIGNTKFNYWIWFKCLEFYFDDMAITMQVSSNDCARLTWFRTWGKI